MSRSRQIGPGAKTAGESAGKVKREGKNCLRGTYIVCYLKVMRGYGIITVICKKGDFVV